MIVMVHEDTGAVSRCVRGRVFECEHKHRSANAAKGCAKEHAVGGLFALPRAAVVYGDDGKALCAFVSELRRGRRSAWASSRRVDVGADDWPANVPAELAP